MYYIISIAFPRLVTKPIHITSKYTINTGFYRRCKSKCICYGMIRRGRIVIKAVPHNLRITKPSVKQSNTKFILYLYYYYLVGVRTCSTGKPVAHVRGLIYERRKIQRTDYTKNFILKRSRDPIWKPAFVCIRLMCYGRIFRKSSGTGARIYHISRNWIIDIHDCSSLLSFRPA
jgi:hypothetical protein